MLSLDVATVPGQPRENRSAAERRPGRAIPADDDPEDNDITIGNPELKFETAWGVDIGLEQRLREASSGLNFFYRKVSDLISLVNTGVPGLSGRGSRQRGRPRAYLQL